jgi:hypothetical protein
MIVSELGQYSERGSTAYVPDIDPQKSACRKFHHIDALVSTELSTTTDWPETGLSEASAEVSWASGCRPGS